MFQKEKVCPDCKKLKPMSCFIRTDVHSGLPGEFVHCNECICEK